MSSTLSTADDTVTSAAGAATSDIIEQYVSTIKTLREVDPTGKALEDHTQHTCLLTVLHQS